jgi:hypothetical protein
MRQAKRPGQDLGPLAVHVTSGFEISTSFPVGVISWFKKMSESSDHYSRLDALWCQYLDLVDQYTSAQAAIQKQLSSGFFSLAQANFKSSGIRYGPDYFDERAVATAKVKISGPDGESRFELRRMTPTSDDNAAASNTGDGDDEAEDDGKAPCLDEKPQLPTPQPTPEPNSKQGRASPEPQTTEPAAPEPADKPDTKETKHRINTHDPLRWFGILVPQSLRAAQNSFSAAVLHDESMAKAINTSRRMREVELEIRRLKKTLRKMEKAAQGGASVATTEEVAARG